MREHEVFRAGGAAFLDPENVGSSVRWNITVHAQAPTSPTAKGYSDLSGEISLTDCSRTITWSLFDDSDEKISRAIAMLRAAQAGLGAAKRAMAKARKELNITD